MPLQRNGVATIKICIFLSLSLFAKLIAFAHCTESDKKERFDITRYQGNDKFIGQFLLNVAKFENAYFSRSFNVERRVQKKIKLKNVQTNSVPVFAGMQVTAHLRANFVTDLFAGWLWEILLNLSCFLSF